MAADAYVVVAPEYNFGAAAPALERAQLPLRGMDYKLAGFVSYGGISGGLRAVRTEKLTLTTLEVVQLVEAVVIPMVAQFLDAGVFRGDEIQTQAAAALLSEFERWA